MRPHLGKYLGEHCVLKSVRRNYLHSLTLLSVECLHCTLFITVWAQVVCEA